MNTSGDLSEKPLGVSIICCTYNGKNRLQKTFEGITNLDYSGNWEFILVDNNSDDGTSDFAKSYFQESPISFKLLQCPTPGKSFALWKAFEAVKYSYILICDDDNQLFPDYLNKGTGILEKNSKIGALGGMGLLPSDILKPEWFQRYQSTYAIGLQADKNGPVKKGVGLYGAGCFFRFQVLQELFKDNFILISKGLRGNTLAGSEDIEMCLAIECLGYEIWYDDQLRFYHNIDEKRLEWNYLLKLISSIALNFPLMEPYRYIILKDSGSYVGFLMKQIPPLVWNFWFTQLLYLLRPKPKNQVFRLTYQYQLIGFFKNFQRSLKAYQKIKPIFLTQS